MQSIFTGLKSTLGRLRLLALLEGISYLLFAVTMPLKYGLDYTLPNKIVGFAHGWLFILYVIVCIQNIMRYKWRASDSLIALMASLIPFGTFYADARIFKPTQTGSTADEGGQN